MNTDHIVLLVDGFALGIDTALLVHFGGRIWDDYRDRRAVRRATTKADAIEARVDALTAGGQE